MLPWLDSGDDIDVVEEVAGEDEDLNDVGAEVKGETFREAKQTGGRGGGGV